MQLVISQTHTLIITGVENINEPEWFDLNGEIVTPGLKYSESERQCPNRKGAELKKKDYQFMIKHRGVHKKLQVPGPKNSFY